MRRAAVGIIMVLAVTLSACSNSGGTFTGTKKESSKAVESGIAADTTATIAGNVETTKAEAAEEGQGLALFGGQTYTEVGQPDALSDDISTYQIQINDCVMEFPMEYSTLLLKGWSVNTLYGNDTSPLSSDDYAMVQFVRGDIQLGFLVFNPDVSTRKVKDCVIAGVEVNLLDYSEDDVIKLPKDVTIGVTGLDEVLTIMGEPDKTDEFRSDDVKVDYWQYCEIEDFLSSELNGLAKKQLTFKNGVLVDIKICCFKATDNFEFSEGNPLIIPDYEVPTELTDKLSDNIVSFGGDLYRLPAPAYAFLENGWEMTKYYKELDDGADTTIAGKDNMDVCLERNGVRVITKLYNPNDEAILVKNTMIHGLGSTYSYGSVEEGVSEISGGIHLGMEEEELENILISENIEYEKDITTSDEAEGSSVTTRFKLSNSVGSAIVCQDGIVTAIRWNVE